MVEATLLGKTAMTIEKKGVLDTEAFASIRGERVFVTGVTSPLGVELVRLLVGGGLRVSGLVRDRYRAKNLLEKVEIIEGGCEEPDDYREPLQASAYVIHLAGMHLASWIVGACAGHDRLTRVLFISSTRVLFPDRLLSREEVSIKKILLEKEAEVSSSPLPWTILRPTLIFSPGDRSLSKLKKFMETKRYFPVPGSGRAVRQPISAMDLSESLVKALIAPAARQKIYNVPGRDVTVHEMLQTMALKTEKNVHFIHVPRMPVAVLKRGCSILGFARRSSSLIRFLRWYEDLCFSGEAAWGDFGHSPRSFEENIREQFHEHVLSNT